MAVRENSCGKPIQGITGLASDVSSKVTIRAIRRLCERRAGPTSSSLAPAPAGLDTTATAVGPAGGRSALRSSAAAHRQA